MTTKTNNNNSILEGLNPAQKDSVIHKGSPLLVLAGAGSGKTRVLTNRVAYLISEGAYPYNILAVTFTNKAAKEMKLRLAKLVGEDEVRQLWIGTFHSVCARILRMDIDKIPESDLKLKLSKNFVIFDETDSTNIVKEAIKALELDPKIYIPKGIRSRISSAKNEGRSAHEFAENALNFREEKIAQIFVLYEELMARNNALDFDDLLLSTKKLLEKNPDTRRYYSNRFRHVLVDEYQDTNRTQYELVRLLAEGCLQSERNDPNKFNAAAHFKERTLTVVGDVDQSIYSWRGADFKIILGFQKDYPNATVIKLEHNYRSTANILQVADSIIANNNERIEKHLVATKQDGNKITVFEAQDELEEAQYIISEIQRRVAGGRRLKDFAILYRTNVQSRAIEEALLRRNIPYVIVGGFRFYDRKEIKDMLAYLKLIFNPSDSQSLKRIINEPRRGIGATTVTKIEEHASKHGYSLYRTMMEISDLDNLSASVQKKIIDFVNLIEEIRQAEKSLGTGDLVEYILRETGYKSMLENSSDSESESRIDNVHEFIGVATDFELNYEPNRDPELSEAETMLSAFLAEISLLSDLDTKDINSNSITMMTLHTAKGLEYPSVFIAGMEEGILPHKRSLDSKDATQLEEERRLMYVGVTRAEETLYLTYARRRRIFGQSEFAIPSRFLDEAPRELLIGYYGQSNSNERGSSFTDKYQARKAKQENPNAIHDGDHADDSFPPDYDFTAASSNYSFGKVKTKVVNKQGQKGFTREEFTDDIPHNLNFQSQKKIPINNHLQPTASPRSVFKAHEDRTPDPNSINTPSSSKAEFQISEKVKHSKFGIGTILQVLGSGNKILYNIDFPEINSKKLLDPKFAKLIKIS